jgi:hypothetical protein
MHEPDSISVLTLMHMDAAMAGIAAGEVGEEFDLNEVRDLLEED